MFLRFAKKIGVDYFFTKMISARSIINHNKKIKELLRMSKIDTPVAIQLFINNTDIILKSISIIEIEINIV